MTAPANLIYSTNPQLGVDTNGHQYCIKGSEDSGIVVAELIGHVLAGFIQVPVPHYAVGRFARNGATHFCSQILSDVIRDVQFYFTKSKIANWDALTKVILLDIWLANNDRNIGNLLGRPRSDIGAAMIDLVAIDFEKSLTVRSTAPLIEIPMKLGAGALWPRGILSKLCDDERVILRPALVDEIKSVSHSQIDSAVNKSLSAAGCYTHQRAATITDVLLTRQQNIEQLARAEWN